MNPIVVLTVLAAVILVGSAIATGVEAAILTVGPIQVHTLTQQRVPGSRALERIKARPGRALALLVVANNLFNISGSMLLGAKADEVFHTSYGGAAGLIAFNALFTVLVILFAEILPKAIGSSFAMPISLVSARVLLLVERLTLPLLLLLEKLMPAITAEAELTTNEREIHLMARLGSQQGQIEADEAAMIGKVFALNDLTARDLMTSRVATPSLAGDASLETVHQQILEAPEDAWWVVLGQEVDEVLGVQSREEALEELLRGHGHKLVSELCDPPQYVPEMIRADRLLTTFRRGDRTSVRVVVDEFGAFVGLVSAADILGVLAGWKRLPNGSTEPQA
ncbi:CNNM domain-containing protein [Vulcanococcus sp.]|jgi:putative hemolysin|uniref:CNNM domain-containing protein n=1 Tax=Vulcanococcus sp. TaxID=2856995 RepID=UPI0037DA5864